jgi:hypothetical protein
MSVASIVNGSLSLSNLAIVNTTTEGACGICYDTNNNLIVSEDTTINQSLTIGGVATVGVGGNTLTLNPNMNAGDPQIIYTGDFPTFQIQTNANMTLVASDITFACGNTSAEDNLTVGGNLTVNGSSNIPSVSGQVSTYDSVYTNTVHVKPVSSKPTKTATHGQLYFSGTNLYFYNPTNDNYYTVQLSGPVTPP